MLLKPVNFATHTVLAQALHMNTFDVSAYMNVCSVGKYTRVDMLLVSLSVCVCACVCVRVCVYVT